MGLVQFWVYAQGEPRLLLPLLGLLTVAAGAHAALPAALLEALRHGEPRGVWRDGPAPTP